MITKQHEARVLALIDANQWLDQRFTYELHQRGRNGNKRHAAIRWCPAAEEWVAKTDTAPNKIFLTETEAAGWLGTWVDLHGGTVLKVACSCHRCADTDFARLVKALGAVSHGACPEHLADMRRMVEELKEGVA